MRVETEASFGSLDFRYDFIMAGLGVALSDTLLRGPELFFALDYLLITQR